MSFGAAIQAMIGADVSDLQSKGNQVEGIAGKMTSALGQIGVGISFGAVTAFFADVTQKAGAVQDLSDKLGVSTDALQAFQYRATQAGASANDASVMWDKARKSIDQLVVGEDAAEKAFARLHLTQQDLINLPLEQQVAKIAAAYAASKNEVGAYDAVTDILGSKTAPRLMQVLGELADEGLPAFTDSARTAGQVIGTETIAKLDEFGDRVATLKGTLTTWGAAALDLAMKFGEGIGYAAAEVVNTFDGIATNYDITAEKAVASSEKQVAAIAPIMAKAETLARMDDEQQRRIIAMLPVKEQIVALEDRALNLRMQAANAGQGTAEWADKEAKARQLFAEAEKLATAEKEKQNLSGEQQIEKAKLLEKQNRVGLTPAEKARLEVLNLQTKQLGIQAELAPLIKKGYDNLSPTEKARFNELVKQNDKIGEQVTKLGKVGTAVAEIKTETQAVGTAIESNTEKWRNFSAVINSVGRGDKELSDRELNRKIENIKADIAQRQISVNRSGFDFLLNPQKFNLQQALAERDFRGDVRRNVAAFGEDRAFQMSGLTESRFAEIIRGLTDNEKTNKTLEQIRDKQETGLNRIAETLKDLRRP